MKKKGEVGEDRLFLFLGLDKSLPFLTFFLRNFPAKPKNCDFNFSKPEYPLSCTLPCRPGKLGFVLTLLTSRQSTNFFLIFGDFFRRKSKFDFRTFQVRNIPFAVPCHVDLASSGSYEPFVFVTTHVFSTTLFFYSSLFFTR
jgi:hypothetical protein